MRIECIERVLVASTDLDSARDRWRRAGFALIPGQPTLDGISFARLAAGAVEIDLCSPAADSTGALATALRDASERGGGIIGWVWGSVDIGASPQGERIGLPGLDGARIDAVKLDDRLAGVFEAAIKFDGDLGARRARLSAGAGENANSIDYLDHIVVMAPNLDDAIAAHESRGVPCKRVREAGRGIRQAFFKLEQTVVEVAAPARARPGCWGLAFMCRDIRRAIDIARKNGLEATEPKTAVQGGQIARIVEPLDGVAVALMQAAPSRS